MIGYRISLAANGLSNLNISSPNHTKGCKIPIVLILSIEIMACSTSTFCSQGFTHNVNWSPYILQHRSSQPYISFSYYLITNSCTQLLTCCLCNFHANLITYTNTYGENNFTQTLSSTRVVLSTRPRQGRVKSPLYTGNGVEVESKCKDITMG